jgi:hypothetical protein
METTAKTKTLQDLTPSDLLKAYSGKANKCACGCAGKYYYRAATQEAGSKDRGYAVGADEVSDAQVTRVLRMVQANEAEAQLTDEYAEATVGSRVYVVYFLAGVSA